MPKQATTSYGGVERLDVLGDTATLLTAGTSDELAEIMRWFVGTGVLGIRQYTGNPAFTKERRHDGYAALNIHDHPNLRGTSGMAELAMIVNGRYVRTRHNDYIHKRSTQGDFLARENITAPPVPAFVLAKPTGLNPDGSLDLVGDTQAKWMKEIHANPQRLRADFVFFEMWLEEVSPDGTVVDAAESERHADYAEDLLEQFELNTRTSLNGVKDPFENVPNRPFISLPFTGEDGKIEHRICQINYRINTIPMGHMGPTTSADVVPRILIGTQNSHSHVLDNQLTQGQYDALKSGAIEFVDLTSTDVFHTHIYRITWDSAEQALSGEDTYGSHQHTVLIVQGFDGALPFDETKARDGVIDSTNRFRLERDMRSMQSFGNDLDAMQDSRAARYECVDAERMLETCWGLEGKDSTLSEEYTFNGVRITFDNIHDAGDENNPTLNSALYNRQADLNRLDASGRRVQHRGFNDPSLFVAMTTHPEVAGGVSWAVPLEVLVRSPLESWNPAGIPISESQGAGELGGGSGTQADPYHTADRRPLFFHTPVAIYDIDPGPTDPADTVTGPRWMRGADGVAYECAASGTWVHTPDGKKTRIPIYYAAQDGSREAVNQRMLQKNLRVLFDKLVAGTVLTDSDLEFLG